MVVSEHALAQLLGRVLLQALVKIPLACKHHLHQLAARYFEIADQAKLLEVGLREGVCVVQHEDGGAILAGDGQEVLLQSSQALHRVRARLEGDLELAAHALQQIHTRQLTGAQHCCFGIAAQPFDEHVNGQTFPRTNLARDDHQPLAFLYCINQTGQGLFMLWTGEEEPGVLRTVERGFSKSEKISVHCWLAPALRVIGGSEQEIGRQRRVLDDSLPKSTPIGSAPRPRRRAPSPSTTHSPYQH